MPHLAVYGHVNVDVILQLPRLPGPDQTVEVLRREMRWGGTAGNVAAVAASLGTPVKLASFVGEDFPPAYRAHLERVGVDVSELVTKKGYGTPTWWGLTDPKHTVLGILDQGPMRDMGNFELLTKSLEGAHTVHLTTGRPAYHARVAEAARKTKAVVAFDPGQELLPLYGPRDLEALLESADLFFANRNEMAVALETLGYGDPTQLFDHNLKAIVETRGAEGVILRADGETVVIPAVAVAANLIADTTGAGDSLRAGFHAARLAGKDFVDACRWGVASASITLQAIGGQARLPTRTEVVAIAETVEVNGR